MKLVLLHGLFMNKFIMVPMGKRLQKLGWDAQCISYPSTHADKDAVYDHLDQTVANGPTILIGHSLGGLVIKDYLGSRQVEIATVPSVITLGTPHQGAKIAGDLKRLKLDRILGTASQFGLLPNEETQTWALPQKLGSLAGNLNIGARPLIDRVWGDPKCASDGTVSVAETRLIGMTDHIVLKQAHTSMVYSKAVANQIIHFAQHGQFQHQD